MWPQLEKQKLGLGTSESPDSLLLLVILKLKRRGNGQAGLTSRLGDVLWERANSYLFLVAACPSQVLSLRNVHLAFPILEWWHRVERACWWLGVGRLMRWSKPQHSNWKTRFGSGSPLFGGLDSFCDQLFFFFKGLCLPFLSIMSNPGNL